MSAKASRHASWQRLPTSPEHRLTQIRRWLRECEDGHSACTPNKHTSLPKRLVELLPRDTLNGRHKESARLVLAGEIAESHPKYTALSYCWGDDGHFKTTRATVAAFRQDIPISELPLSFADAFYLTRQLDIRYIWVDALCIVQDDELDWGTETSKMHGVYTGSFLTIQASEARSVSEGLFVGPTLADTHPYGRAFFTTMELGETPGTLIHVVPHTPRIAALNTRGWTLQEELLSHRTIQLTNYELRWSCRSDLLWETGIMYKNTERLYGCMSLPQKDHDQSWNELWWSWMENYSARRFKLPRDRLPGIAGLVNLYQRETMDEACLGLWRRSLHKDLEWVRWSNSSERSSDSPLFLSIPSWSPFACRQTVRFNPWTARGREKVATIYASKVIDCNIEWSGKPFLSSLRSTILVLHAPTKELYLAEATEVKGCNPPYFNINSEVLDHTKSPLPWRCSVQWDQEGYREPGKWCCLLLQRRNPTILELGVESFLILEATGSEVTWRRIGIGKIRHSKRELAWTFDLGDCRTIALT